MKYVYPAVFTEENGNYTVNVPDLPGCRTFGENLSEAIEMARDAISMWLCIAEDKNEEIPAATARLAAANGIVSYVDVDTEAYRQQTDSHSVRKTLSIPCWLNARAELSGINFSNVLQNALMEQLHIQG